MTSNIKFQTLQSSPPTVRSVRFKSRYFTLIIILFFSIWLLFGLLSISHVDVTSFVWTPKQSSLSRFTNNKISNFVKKIESVFPDLMHQIEGTLHEETLSKISRHRQNQNNDKLPLQTQSTIASEKSSTSIKDINIHQKSKKPFVERGINHSGSGSQQYLSSFYNMDPAVLVVGGTGKCNVQ